MTKFRCVVRRIENPKDTLSVYVYGAMPSPQVADDAVAKANRDYPEYAPFEHVESFRWS